MYACFWFYACLVHAKRNREDCGIIRTTSNQLYSTFNKMEPCPSTTIVVSLLTHLLTHGQGASWVPLLTNGQGTHLEFQSVTFYFIQVSLFMFTEVAAMALHKFLPQVISVTTTSKALIYWSNENQNYEIMKIMKTTGLNEPYTTACIIPLLLCYPTMYAFPLFLFPWRELGGQQPSS